MTDYCIVMTTVAAQDDVNAIVAPLLERQLAACIQVLPISSYYTWKGAVANESELLLLIKTRASHYDAVAASIIANHKYETPEIIRVPITAGSAPYLAWIDQVTQLSEDSE